MSEQINPRVELQAAGKHPAPCARHCEATEFEIEIRHIKAERDALAARLVDAEHDRDEFKRVMSELATKLEARQPVGWFHDVNRHNGRSPLYEHVADEHGGEEGTVQLFASSMVAASSGGGAA